MNLICPHCKSSNVEKRGTRLKDDETLLRLKCNACKKWSTVLQTYADETIPSQDPEALIKGYTKFIITSAQNNTPVDTKFWKALKHLAAYKKAQILVVPVLYRNPTNPGEMEKEAWWPTEVQPYLMGKDLKLASNMRVIGDARIAATSQNPLVGFESLTGPCSAIFGHAQIQMKTIATPQNRLPKILYTTGSCSVKNYSKSKTGKKADFHHSLGATIVELDPEEDIFHIRNFVGDEKSEFYDVDLYVTSKGVKKCPRVEALILGDEHVIENCPDTKAATFDGPNSIVQVCKPKYIVRHDVIDSYSISHHHRQTPSIRYKKHKQGTDRLIDELNQTARFIEATTPDFATSVIIPSNHHSHITRWLEEVDWRHELHNAQIYHEMWAAWLFHIDQGEAFEPFSWWMKKNCKAEAMYPDKDYPFIVKGIYLSYHGDRGADGAKGHIAGFAKIGAKTVTGHSHSPGIEKGAYRVGTSSKLKLEYTSGPSSWLNTHCIISPNGKRQLINVIYGDWRVA